MPEKLDPKGIFDVAESFHQTANLLEQEIAKSHFQYTSPWATNLGFAIELYLKCLLVLINPDAVPRGHLSQALFDDLDLCRGQNVSVSV